jgi:hypothetical protein
MTPERHALQGSMGREVNNDVAQAGGPATAVCDEGRMALEDSCVVAASIAMGVSTHC